MLNDVDLSLSLSDTAYKYIRGYQQQRLYELEKAAFDKKVPTVIIFEGWDAAGKGSTIQEMTQQLDPRGFKVYNITAPRTHETKLPWLWRFWLKTPRYGEMAIFDRSWYRRVTIERIEGKLAVNSWQDVYSEINDFEKLLADDGVVFIKLWLHISEEHQLRRYIQLRQDPEQFWQITEAYWQRHRQYKEYFKATEIMLEQTSTTYAPWSIIPANDDNYRIYTAFKVIINRLEQALDLSPTQWLDLADLEKVAAHTRKKKRKS